MTQDNELIAKLAFSFFPKLKSDLLLKMRSDKMTAFEFFNANPVVLMDKFDLRFDLASFETEKKLAVSKATEEFSFINKHNIKFYSLLDDDYPWLLSQIMDPPVVLFQLGDLNLNGEHNLSVVGTRRCTSYGVSFCNELVKDLGEYFQDLKIISGLAYGIDAAAHQAALDSGIPTIAVVAHGLDMIYPSGNRSLARNIIKNGGAIISEYPSKSTPYAGRFLERNRIVAGLSQMTMIVESEIKGGAMSTANLAFHYNREVGALPGRKTDKTSSGCNHLIRNNKASLVSSAAELITTVGWKPLDIAVENRQLNLFPELEGDALKIYEFLKFSNEPKTLDAIQQRTAINPAALMASLTELEFDGIIQRQPGGRYSIS